MAVYMNVCNFNNTGKIIRSTGGGGVINLFPGINVLKCQFNIDPCKFTFLYVVIRNYTRN
jgi:hypothetical protein